MHQKI